MRRRGAVFATACALGSLPSHWALRMRDEAVRHAGGEPCHPARVGDETRRLSGLQHSHGTPRDALCPHSGEVFPEAQTGQSVPVRGRVVFQHAFITSLLAEDVWPWREPTIIVAGRTTTLRCV